MDLNDTSCREGRNLLIVISSGVIISWLSIRSVRAARDEISWLVERFKFYHEAVSKNALILDVTGQPTRHRFGHSLSAVLPRLYFVLWIFIAVFVLIKVLQRH